MSTITREWLQQAINDYESVRDELPFGLDDYQGNILAALRIALASLEAEPIGEFHIAEQQVDGTSDYIKDGEWPIDNGIIEVYAAPPVPVVPAALPENDDEDGHDIDYLEPSEVYALGRTAGWNACRAAMLQGAEPVSQPYTLPDGWVAVPVEPTEDMVIAGFEAELREEFRDPEAWEAFEAMSGCEQAAHRAKLCWAAMIAAAPHQEVRCGC
ncbi:DUF551 domain-containing protein [Escherichia coli]|uniref:DUF551 domain-containing protein n=1 Tax=Escherichia coli TaxID=562 RepID=UPI003C2C2CD8